MAFFAVGSDENNQKKYKQQHAENLARVKAREQAEQCNGQVKPDTIIESFCSFFKTVLLYKYVTV